jgi:hypothetical protein
VGTIYSEPILAIGVPNRNGRVYARHAVENALNNSAKTISGKIGMEYEEGKPYNDAREITHWCSNLRIEGEQLVADVRFKENVEGRMLESMVRKGAYVFRTASLVHQIGENAVVNSFTIISINAVIAVNAA